MKYSPGDIVYKITNEVDTSIPVGSRGVVRIASGGFYYVIWDSEDDSIYRSYGRAYLINLYDDGTGKYFVDNCISKMTLASEWESEIEFS